MTDWNYTDDFFQDADTFGVPRLGGDVAVRYGTVDYTDTTATTLFTLPIGSIPVDIMVDTTLAFDAGSSNVLDVGLGSDADYFVNDLDVSAAGVDRYGDTSVIAARMFGSALTEDTAVTATYVPGGTAATEGTAVVAIWYIRK